jgi:hypothetical protein
LSIEQNIKNAQIHYEEDENGIPKLFSTNMFALAEEILPLIDSELKKVIAENEQKKSKKQKTADNEQFREIGGVCPCNR